MKDPPDPPPPPAYERLNESKMTACLSPTLCSLSLSLFLSFSLSLSLSHARALSRSHRLALHLNYLDRKVFFSGDNGPDGHGFELFDDPGIFRGKKRSLHEGGIRQTILAYWPGTIAAGVRACGNFDMIDSSLTHR